MASARRQLNERQADFVPILPTDEKPSMGDAEFVEGRIRVMLDEARKVLESAPNPPQAITGIAHKFGREFRADNEDYVQTWDIDAQDIFLKARGLGSDDNAPGDPVLALVAETLRRFCTAAQQFHEDTIDASQMQFAIDTAVEDCMMLLRGMDNPAD
jgi:hypothetical protein